VAQPLVLAIEPDLRQAAIVKRIVKEKARADVAVVDSRDAAIAAIKTSMPDVLLLSALMSPRDEDELMAHLRTLENASHLQPHTIPQLASALSAAESRSSGGLFSSFLRKKEPETVISGCDPDLFGEEVRVYIQQAADKKRELLNSARPAPDVRPGSNSSARQAAPDPEPAAPSSSWSSPFEWKPSGSSRSTVQQTRAPEFSVPEFKAPESIAPEPSFPEASAAEASVHEPSVPEPFVPEPVLEAPVVVEPLAAVAATVKDEPRPEAVEPVTLAAAPEPAVTTAPENNVVRIADHEPVQGRAEKIVARVHADSPAKSDALKSFARNEWTRDSKVSERLGPLARWARSEPVARPKAAPVTADDVRALIASLSVPPAVASVTYARGCRIRRVRVPAAPDSDTSEVPGPVIVSKKLLAEQRDKRPTA